MRTAGRRSRQRQQEISRKLGVSRKNHVHVTRTMFSEKGVKIENWFHVEIGGEIKEKKNISIIIINILLKVAFVYVIRDFKSTTPNLRDAISSKTNS